MNMKENVCYKLIIIIIIVVVDVIIISKCSEADMFIVQYNIPIQTSIDTNEFYIYIYIYN